MAFALDRMKIFTVHLHPQRRPLAEHAQFVPEGFNVWAFAFGWLWAVTHKLWWVAGALVLIALSIHMAQTHGILGALEANVLKMGIGVLVGFEGNDWRRTALAKRGWVQSDIVAEDSLLHAQQRYFARHASLLQAPAAATAPVRPTGPWSGAA